MRGRLGKSFSKLTAMKRYVFFAVPPSKVTIGLGSRELTKAKSYYGNIKFRLTPVVCSNCNHENIINTGICEKCGQPL